MQLKHVQKVKYLKSSLQNTKKIQHIVVKTQHFSALNMCDHNCTTRIHMAVKQCRQSKAETYIYMARYVGYSRSFECRSALCKPFIITIHQLVMHHFFSPFAELAS